MSVFKIYRDVRLVGGSTLLQLVSSAEIQITGCGPVIPEIFLYYAYMLIPIMNQRLIHRKINLIVRPMFFKISTKGIQEGDFTMVFGYPGTTNEYLTSYAIEQIQQVENPHKIAIRTAKLNIIDAAMEQMNYYV